MDTERFLKAAQLLVKERQLRGKATALWEQAKKLLGNTGTGLAIMAVGFADLDNGDVQVTVEIPLHEYLARWPDATPTFHTFEREAGPRGYLSYPYRHAGAGKGVSCFVDARTPAVDLPKPPPPPPPAENAEQPAA